MKVGTRSRGREARVVATNKPTESVAAAFSGAAMSAKSASVWSNMGFKIPVISSQDEARHKTRWQRDEGRKVQSGPDMGFQEPISGVSKGVLHLLELHANITDTR